jgi:hypothetical protein
LKRIAAVALVLTAGTAIGQQLPNFEIEKHCDKAAGGRDYCVERTQGIYEDLRQRWDTIPAETKGRCLGWLKTSGHPDSYYLLQMCLRNEMPPPPPYYYRY